MKKRIISLLLCLVLIVSLVPAAAAANTVALTAAVSARNRTLAIHPLCRICTS